MKNVKGWWLPEWDNHFEKMMLPVGNDWAYQQESRDYALSFVKNWNIALDIGSNVGFWSKELCDKFNTVWAFEPHPENIDCYRKNLETYSNYHLEEIALADHQEQDAVLWQSPDESGNVSLIAHGVENGNSIRKLTDHSKLKKLTTDVKMLDDYIGEFEGKNIDFIKVDCQEHEKEITQGGLNLIKNHNAVVCLELPLRDRIERAYHDEVVKMLNSIGYHRRGNKRKETIFTR